MTRHAPQHRWGIAFVCAVAVFATSGCVTLYQPLTSLQRPVAVDPQLANFEGARFLLRCHPGKDLSASDAQKLCRGVGTSFRNQGAQVDVEIPRPGRASRTFEEEEKPDLVIDVRSRLLHRENSSYQFLLAYVTLSIVPMVEEFSYAQDVTIRDRQGGLLAQDTYQARFIEYRGVGVWAVNWVADYAVRKKEDRVSGNVAARDFSSDLYGQLSQLAFNARVRQTVLGDFRAPPPPAGTPAPAPATAPAPSATPLSEGEK